MKLKMLVSTAGAGFSLSPGEETDRFTDKEAARMIKVGMAEKAPPAVVKKPETKAEWDDERDKLLAENVRMTAELEAAAERETKLVGDIAVLTAFKSGVVSAIGTLPAPIEIADAPATAEKRG